MAKNDDIYFIRWGNLNPIKHKEVRGADETSWAHIAPRYRGIYAFPRGYVERFLIGGDYTDHAKRLLKYDGKPILCNDFYDEENDYKIKLEYKKLLKRLKIKETDITSLYINDNCYIAYFNKPKIFNYKGDIWHHFGDYVDKANIIESERDWVKTTYDVYVKALHKATTKDRFDRYLNEQKWRRRWQAPKISGDPHTYPINDICKDFYEVFIEKIK